MRKLVAIQAYYEALGERVGGVIIYEKEHDRVEATVSNDAHTLFLVKLLVSDDDEGVREYSREEML